MPIEVYQVNPGLVLFFFFFFAKFDFKAKISL